MVQSDLSALVEKELEEIREKTNAQAQEHGPYLKRRNTPVVDRKSTLTVPNLDNREEEEKRTTRGYYAGVVTCASGIIGTLVCYGILQERIMTRPYGDGQGEYFKHSLLIVFVNRTLTCLVALVTNVVKGQPIRPIAPLYSYASISLSNVVATSCQYEALKYVTFPVQTLAKTAKMVPVMLWGTVILAKRYTWPEYSMAVLVTLGCTLFLLSGDAATKVSSRHHATEGSAGAGGAAWGGALMAGYLGFDGFTSTFQERLFRGYEMTSHHQVLFITAFSSALALLSLVTAGALGPALSFVSDHPACLWDMLLISSTAVTSQFVIAYTIKTYGALVFAAIMTTRQLISILVSNILFRHPMEAGQWFGLIIVFGTLYAKIKMKGKGRKPTAAVMAPSGAEEERQPLQQQA